MANIAAMLEQARLDLAKKDEDCAAAHAAYMAYAEKAQAKGTQLSDRLTLFLGEREALDLLDLPAGERKRHLEDIQKREAAATKEVDAFADESGKETQRLLGIRNPLAADVRRLKGRVEFFERIAARIPTKAKRS